MFYRIPTLALFICFLSMAGLSQAARPTHSSQEVAGSLLITEISRSGTNSGFADSIEIMNVSPYEWDLTNVFASDCLPDGADTSGDSFRFPDGSSIKPYACAVLFFDRDVTQAMIDTLPTSTTSASGGVKVYVPEVNANGPSASLVFQGQPVGYMPENGGDVSGGTIGGADTIVLGWKATLPANAPGSPSFTIDANDVIDGFAWSESGSSPGSFTWGPGATDTNFFSTDSSTNVDSFKRKPDASATRPIDTNSPDDWTVGAAVGNLNFGKAAWVPKQINAPGDAESLIVTEVNRSGSTNTSFSAEFIEIVNNSPNDYSLKNLFVSDLSVSGTLSTGDGSLSFPPEDVFPARSTLVVVSDKDAPSTSTFANIPTTHTLSPGGIFVYGIDNNLTSVALYQFGGVAVRKMLAHAAEGDMSLSNSAENIELGVNTNLVDGIAFAVDQSMIIDGMGYREGSTALNDTIGWALNNSTSDEALAVQTDNSTRPDSFHRVSLTDTNTPTDWTIGSTSLSTPGNPEFLLTGQTTTPIPSAVLDWNMFE